MELTGEAGSLLNMARYLGMSVGIAGASALLALRLGRGNGAQGSTMDVSAPTLVAASRDVILLLGCFVALAELCRLTRTVPRKNRGADDGEPAGAAIAAPFERLLQLLHHAAQPLQRAYHRLLVEARPLHAQQHMVGAGALAVAADQIDHLGSREPMMKWSAAKVSKFARMRSAGTKPEAPLQLA